VRHLDSSRFPGLLVPGNINLARRPVVHNKDGSISTVRSFSIGTPRGEVLIPQVVGGGVVPVPVAIRHYKLTGQHLGIFASPAAANRYAIYLHNQQARRYGAALGAAAVGSRVRRAVLQSMGG
jgi:hypothetical protein